MKKILLVILCFIIPLSFVSCGKENTEKPEEKPVTESKTNSETELNNLFSLMPSKTESEQETDQELEYKGKKVKEVKLNSSVGIPMDFDADALKALEDLENEEPVSDVSFDALFGNLIITYDDGTDETVGQIYLGSDKALYLKFSNSKNKDVAYKLSDPIF